MNIVIDKLIRSKRRSIGLEITADSKLVVRAPLRVPKKTIEEAVLEKAAWIEEKQEQAKLRRERHPAAKLANGEPLLLFGVPLRIVFDPSAKEIHTEKQSLILPESLRGTAIPAVTAFYKKQAFILLKERTDFHAARAGVRYTSLKITSALSRWGSCSGGKLCFTWRLAMAPVEMIDYVVVHELSHITHPNHSAAFWNRVYELMPDYKRRLSWFREHAALLRPDIFEEDVSF